MIFEKIPAEMTAFAAIFKAVEKSHEADKLRATVEDSPYHREENTWVHTCMTLAAYFERQAKQYRTTHEFMLTATALLFHDFGKPDAEETIHREDGTTYRRYAGHEKISANSFVDFVTQHRDLFSYFTDTDLHAIKLMIEQHLPFGLKDKTKLANLRAVLKKHRLSQYASLTRCFADHLICDCAGRISDDHPTKMQAVRDWCGNVLIVDELFLPYNEIGTVESMTPAQMLSPKVAYVLSGPVGAGKSTWTEKFKHDMANWDIAVLSDDTLRIAFAEANMSAEDKALASQLTKKQLYDVSWMYCNEHEKEYRQYSDWFIREALNDAANKIVVVDRTNQTRKSRAKIIADLRAKGFLIVGVEFWVPRHVSQERQLTREDKKVPRKTVDQIYFNNETTWIGVEVDFAQIVF